MRRPDIDTAPFDVGADSRLAVERADPEPLIPRLPPVANAGAAPSRAGAGCGEQDFVPYAEVPLTDENGKHIFDYVLSQDMVAWYAQGEITDRTQEHLGTTDVSIIEHRRLLREQIEVVMDGGEPINVFRDPAANESLEMALYARPDAALGAREFVNQSSAAGYYRSNFHKISKAGWPYIDDDADKFCPDRDLILELYRKSEAAWEAKQTAETPAGG